MIATSHLQVEECSFIWFLRWGKVLFTEAGYKLFNWKTTLNILEPFLAGFEHCWAVLFKILILRVFPLITLLSTSWFEQACNVGLHNMYAKTSLNRYLLFCWNHPFLFISSFFFYWQFLAVLRISSRLEAWVLMNSLSFFWVDGSAVVDTLVPHNSVSAWVWHVLLEHRRTIFCF